MASAVSNEIDGGGAGPSRVDDEEKDKGAFHVNRNLIPEASLEEQAMAELEGLDLDIFNQDDFEQGVMAQVDQALEKEEEERKKKLLEKELKGINDDMKSVRQELVHIVKTVGSLAASKTSFSAEENRKLEAIKRQKENKLNQLKKLKARKKAVTAKLEGVEENSQDEEAVVQEGTDVSEVLMLAPSKKKETEMEMMIRRGEMTPFGTIVQTNHRESHDPEPGTSGEEDIEKKSRKKRKSSSSREEGESSSEEENKKPKKENFFDQRDKRHYPNYTEGTYTSSGNRRRSRVEKIGHNFSEDIELSDVENGEYENEEEVLSSEQEYVPDEEEEEREQSSEEGEVKVITEGEQVSREKSPRKKRKGKFKKIQHAKYKEETKGSNTPKKTELPPMGRSFAGRDPVVRKAVDDGDEDSYYERLDDFNASELARQRRVDEGEESESDSDEEVDSGFIIPGRLWSKLYKYQKTCVKWLWELHVQGAGGIVGDEMGLGKTIQMITFLAGLKYSKVRNKNFSFIGLGPTLIVTPTTVMHQWVKEFHTWWPSFRVAILHSSGSHTGSDKQLIHNIIHSNGILITSYSTLVIHQESLLPYDWHYIVLDEGHKIRNPDTQATLVVKQFRTPHRIILSGSPIQNNLKELWSLFDFVFPGKLGTLPDFLQHFAAPIVQGGYSNATDVQVKTAYKCACVLRDTINPYLLRRMKADVQANLNLPSKNEQVLFCRLTKEQREVYTEYLESKECESILSGRLMIFCGLITLRKICNHPDLSTGGPRVFVGESTQNDETLEYGYWKRSGKMIVVEALLKLWKRQGHKVLLFTQGKQMLDVLESFVQMKNYSYMRMDGGTSIVGRQPLINKFNTDPNIYVFLLTTKVGGLGVNLIGANRVIIFDPDWNPSTDLQARERSWRIGQKRQVTVYRLLTTGTIEEKIYHRQIFKQFLTNRVLKDPKQRRLFKSNDMYELFSLGASDDKRQTETAAIFAGTGSDVVVRPKKVNRFDKLKEGKKKVAEEEEKDANANFDEEEVSRMREMAKRLSQQISQGLFKSKYDPATKLIKKEKSDSSQEDKIKHDLDVKAKAKVRRTKSDSSLELENKKSRSEESSEHPRRHKKKKKHRRKERDAKFEGERIPHLDKHGSFKQAQEANEKEKHDQMDDYVLKKLFKKTGIQGALHHDKIMAPGHSDYVLVEAEAEKVAKQASAALKRSRSQCMGARAGVPTWTGQHGSLVKKPRFGQKKNTMLSGPEQKKPPPVVVKEEKPATMGKDKDSHFDGSMAGNVQMDTKTGATTAGPLSSSDLLTKMKRRNEVLTAIDTVDDADSETAAPDVDSYVLINKLREFIMFECQQIGQATTKEILAEFGPKLPPSDSAKFRAMLNSICDFIKGDGSGNGVWKLRSDYR